MLAHDLHGDALALPDQAEQDVLGADVVVLDRSASRSDSSSVFLARGVNGMCPLGCLLPRPTLSTTSSRTPSLVNPEVFEDLAGDRLGLAEQAEQDVLGPDVVVVQPPRLFLGHDDGVARSAVNRSNMPLSLPGAFNPVNTMLLIG